MLQDIMNKAWIAIYKRIANFIRCFQSSLLPKTIQISAYITNSLRFTEAQYTAADTDNIL